MRLIPKNWRDFQHYKDRNPPWIRLHKGLLDNYEFQCLPVASRALAPMLWLLASDHMEGVIDADPKKLAFRLRMNADEVVSALQPLIDNGFFEVQHDASDVLAECLRDAVPETEAETEALQKEPTVLVPEDADASRRPSPCPNEQIVDLYHRHLPTLPRVEVLSDTRKRTIAARWREVLADPDIKSKPDPRSAAIEFFDWYFDHAAKSRFLTGKAKDWRADFDFLMTPTKFVKVIEGHYHKEAA